jgi:acetoin utilization deacetylase AcuC-like enzyme
MFGSSAASWSEMSVQAQKDLVQGLGYLIDDRYLLHDTGKRHPESPQRLVAINEVLDSLDDAPGWQPLTPRMASFDELELVHDASHIQRVEYAARCAPSYLDQDTPVSSESYEIALLAAGGVLESVDAVCSGRMRRVFAFVRPPGHHAHAGDSKGFCLFNNVALAAAYAIRKHKLERVAIADFDVHHGDGTQSCFYSTPDVLYISSHQFPFYPGTGDFSEIGKGEGRGLTVNFPLAEGTGDPVFIPIYSKLVSAILDQFMPQLILVSAGFDGHFRDPLGGLTLTHSGYRSAAASLILAAERYCQGKICFVLEGGYNLEALKACSRSIMDAMEQHYPEEASVREGSVFTEIARKIAMFGPWRF